jgi:hypothetical protein
MQALFCTTASAEARMSRRGQRLTSASSKRRIERDVAMRVASIFCVGVLMLFAVPAEALTITNSDADSHKITVKVGGDAKELTIAPQTEVDPPCDKGCTVELESGEQYEMQGGEQASIEDGVLFVDAASGAGGDADADSKK